MVNHRRLHFAKFYAALLGILLSFWGCQSAEKLVGGPSQKFDTSDIRYSLIYVIHGDGNYLYHDEDGHSLQADEQTVAGAKKVARQARHGEVFIFHLNPERKRFWFFPGKDRQFWLFRDGKLVKKEKYSPSSKSKNFRVEAHLYHQLHQSSAKRKVFAYFGHEVPGPGNDISYFQSRPHTAFNTKTFKNGIASFLSDSSNDFNLTILSTCDNGTPGMVSSLEGETQFLLASPQNLHLSFIDTDSLLMLEHQPMPSTQQLARAIASDTFKRLSKFIQTAITLSIYNMESVNGYVDALTKDYSAYLMGARSNDLSIDNVDCADLPFWGNRDISKGVRIYYQAPKFGRRRSKQSHSGWGCRQR